MFLDTPVAFFIFNRPELTKVVFEAIAQAKPKKLLVVADGPRVPEEVEKCQKTREIIDRVDWDCQILTNYSEVNLGCKRRVSSGLDWVFSEVEEAIILEDDCLPAPSFFYFCQTLLDHYRNDRRIMMISGDSFLANPSQNDYSYSFTKYIHIWGWATWRRAWKHYDVNIKTWPEYKKLDILSSLWESPSEQKYWTDIFDRVFEGTIDTWDYQWAYACWSQSGISIIPNANLVSNLGFGPEATHTLTESPWARLPVDNILEIKHPSYVVRDRGIEQYVFQYVMGGKPIDNEPPLLANIFHYISRMKNKLKF